MVNYKLLIGLFLMLSSCNCDDDPLTLERMDYTGTELRTDGYYFYEFQSDVPRYDIYFLYKNGVILYGESPAIENVLDQELKYSSGEFYNMAKNIKDGWGVFKVFDNEIEFERWYPSGPPLETWVRAGTIINNETFRITKLSRPDGSDAEIIDELYKFKAFSPKPDSTNVFIK